MAIEWVREDMYHTALAENAAVVAVLSLDELNKRYNITIYLHQDGDPRNTKWETIMYKSDLPFPERKRQVRIVLQEWYEREES